MEGLVNEVYMEALSVMLKHGCPLKCYFIDQIHDGKAVAMTSGPPNPEEVQTYCAENY
jgi:hypothetical protein